MLEFRKFLQMLIKKVLRQKVVRIKFPKVVEVKTKSRWNTYKQTGNGVTKRKKK